MSVEALAAPAAVRTRPSGVFCHVPELISEGLTLVAGSWGGRTVRLVDEGGAVVHTWELPWPPGLGQTLTTHGTLLANGKIVDDHEFLGGLPFQGGVIAEFDWSGELLWEVRYSGHHHDGILLANGNVMLLGVDRVPDEIAARVRGGIEVSYGLDEGDEVSAAPTKSVLTKSAPAEAAPAEAMWVDTLVELTRAGDIVWEWKGWEHLDTDTDVIGPGAMDRSEWTHANGLVELPSGEILVSARQLSTVLRVSRTTGEITRRYGSGSLAGQHSPWLTDTETLLVFDNGFNRQDGMPPYSRLVEFDLDSGEEIWEYRDPVPWELFSALQSSAQRLANGNTLACEGLTGRLLEVTPQGELAWEYVNPHHEYRADTHEGIRSNRMFRARKYPRAAFARPSGEPEMRAEGSEIR